MHVLLIECEHIYWKNLELELLILYTNIEQKYWKDRKHDFAVNNMIRVIGMAESLNKLREEGKTL